MNINSRILGKIEEWQKREGSLPEVLRLYKELLSAQVEASSQVSPARPELNKAEAEAKIRQGIPLLKWDSLLFDWQVVSGLFQKVIDILGNYHEDYPVSLRDMATDLPALQASARAWYEYASLAKWAQAKGVDEDILRAVIHNTVKPFMITQTEALQDLIPQKLWRRSYCPVCRGKADIASLKKDEGARWLLCSRCDTEWLFQRLECPYCNNKEQTSLKFYTDERGLYRLYICNECRCYLKAIDLRKTEDDVLLPFERVVTIDLDRQGHEMGYRGGWDGGTTDRKQ